MDFDGIFCVVVSPDRMQATLSCKAAPQPRTAAQTPAAPKPKGGAERKTVAEEKATGDPKLQESGGAAFPDAVVEPEMVDAAALIAWLRSKHELADIDTATVAAIVAAFNETRAAGKAQVIARGVPAKRGVDGAMAWAGDYFDTKPKADAAKAVDFYAISRIANVSAEDLVVTVTAPQPGVPGRGVTGEAIPAEDGCPAAIKAGTGIVVREGAGNAGAYHATMGGRLLFEGGVLSVNPTAQIDGDLGFEVGNIDFRGSVQIKGAVLDNFKVKATGDVTVGQWVQAAQIDAGGNVTVNSGISGKGKGQVRCDGEAKAKYLNDARVLAKKGVTIASECLASFVATNGIVTIARGQLSGGTMIARGGGEVGVLGTDHAVKTLVYLGRDFFAEEELEALETEIAERTEKLVELRPKMEPLRAGLMRLKKEQRLQAEAVLKAADAEEAALKNAEERRDRLTAAARPDLKAQLKVHTMIHPGVVIHLGKSSKTIAKSVTGPVLVRYHEDRQELVIDGAS